MTAIEILRRCRKAPDDIERLEVQIQRRHDAMTAISAPQGDPNGGGRSQHDPDKYGRLYCEIDMLDRRLQERRNRQRIEVAAACALVDMLPDREGDVIDGYYVRGETVAASALRLHLTENYLRKCKSRAERRLEELEESTVIALVPGWYLEGDSKG